MPQEVFIMRWEVAAWRPKFEASSRKIPECTQIFRGSGKMIPARPGNSWRPVGTSPRAGRRSLRLTGGFHRPARSCRPDVRTLEILCGTFRYLQRNSGECNGSSECLSGSFQHHGELVDIRGKVSKFLIFRRNLPESASCRKRGRDLRTPAETGNEM